MQEWQDLIHYVGFDAEDERLLQQLLTVADPELPRIIDSFYAAVLRSPARNVLENDAQIERLKVTLNLWIRDFLRGPHDDAYWERRSRIGRTHVRIGLPHRYVFGAMNLIRQDLMEIAILNFSSEEANRISHAVARLADLELAVMSSTYMDAHEAIQLRSLQELIIRSMPVTILCLDSGGRVTAATRPSARLFGEKAELGLHYEAFLPPDLLEAADLPTLLGRCLATGEELSVPRIVLGAGPEARHFRLSIVPLEHELARMLVHLEETTDVVQAEARAHQAEALARIGSLAANVAHEIRNPLTAISTTLQVISNSMPPEDRRKMILGKVGDQVLRLDRLVSDLLGYARKAVPRPQRVSLLDLVQEASVAAGVAIALEGTPALVLADPQFVSQILVNLLQNSRDAAGPEGRVRAVFSASGVAIEDNGPGVPVDLREKIFEPFVTTKTRGTGLGLAISRKLAESMGGSLGWRPALWPEAGPGPGARFELRLPAGG